MTAITELMSVVTEEQKQFQAAIAEQRNEFEARLKQQDAEIQRVNNRIELSEAASARASRAGDRALAIANFYIS